MPDVVQGDDQVVLAQRRELQAEYDRLCEIIDADVSAKLNKEWLKVQEPMFTAGQPAVVYDELQARLDDIAARRDAAWAEEKAAWQRRSEISEILYGRVAS